MLGKGSAMYDCDALILKTQATQKLYPEEASWQTSVCGVNYDELDTIQIPIGVASMVETFIDRTLNKPITTIGEFLEVSEIGQQVFEEAPTIAVAMKA